MQKKHLAMVVIAWVASVSSALAWDPNQGGEPVASSSNLPSYVVPQRYYAPTYNPASVPVTPVYNAPVAQVAVTQAPGYSAPIATTAPAASNVYVQPAPTPLPPPAPAAVVPVAPEAYPSTYAAHPADATAGLVRNRYSLGIEAMYDNYEEPDTFPDLHEDSYYGGITGSMTHYFTRQFFAGVDGRASYGPSDYYSSDGHGGDVPEWEFESRLTAGWDITTSDHAHLKPYAGVGTRYYYDNGKGDVTDLGVNLYDRRIWQFYIPVGATYDYTTRSGLMISPNFEVDPLVYGQVQTRLGEIPGYSNANNEQHDGIGYRAQIMFSERDDNGKGWEFGPFFRYWDIKNSDSTTIAVPTSIAPSGQSSAFEPHNNRFQLGADLKYLF